MPMEILRQITILEEIQKQSLRGKDFVTAHEISKTILLYMEKYGIK